MKIDMSPEAITNRLKIMEQLWELSVSLMQAEFIENKEMSDLVESLRRHGIKDEIVASALSDLRKVA